MNKAGILKDRIKDKYSETNVNNIIRVYNKILELEKESNKNIEQFTKEDFYNVIISFKSKSYSTNLVYMRAVNTILEELNLETRLSLKEDNIDLQAIADENLKKVANIKEYFTTEEIESVISMLQNPVDQFLVYGLFKGIELDDLISLKTEQIDLKKKKIMVFGKTVQIDEIMFSICTDLMETREYYKYIPGGNAQCADTYEFNMSSPYAIKVRPLSTNNNGKNHMSRNAAKQKLVNLSEQLSNDNFKIKLTLVGLKRSGMYSYINETCKGKDEETVRAALRAYAESNNLKRNEKESWNVYSALYFDALCTDK